ncbi:unnamed protein product [Cylindrotheca closterium]|uniref:Uncharacterized protein n=1 Tax=Cylindrotheca closterium TaxID=2856 RepID=A0AAD2CM34_9STRA|nr:unnamed protein product [Cylindrotheca closterium]
MKQQHQLFAMGASVIIFLMASRVYMFLHATEATMKVSAKEEWYPSIKELNTQDDDEPSEEGIPFEAMLVNNKLSTTPANTTTSQAAGNPNSSYVRK